MFSNTSSENGATTLNFTNKSPTWILMNELHHILNFPHMSSVNWSEETRSIPDLWGRFWRQDEF